MASDRFVQLVRALKKGTDEQQIFWEDLPDEEMFRANVLDGLVRIGPSSAASTTRKGYTLWLITQGGAIAAEVDFLPDEPGYDLIEDLYRTARLVARGGDRMVDNIIQFFNPTGGRGWAVGTSP